MCPSSASCEFLKADSLRPAAKVAFLELTLAVWPLVLVFRFYKE